MRAIWVILSLLRCDWSTWVKCQNDVKSMQIRSCDRLETIDLLSLLLSDWLVPRVASITTKQFQEIKINSFNNYETQCKSMM